MSEDTTLTAEAKLAEAEAKLSEFQQTIDDLTLKLNNIPNNPEHFNQLKQERDEAKRKLKEIEDAQAEAQGEFKKLAEERLTALEAEKAEKLKFKEQADNWAQYLITRKETLLAKLTDEKDKRIAGALPTLELIEEYVEAHLESNPETSSGNHKPPKPDDKKQQPFTVDYSPSGLVKK